MSWACTIGIWSTLTQFNFIRQIYSLCHNAIYNIACKFVHSNSIARACFIFLLCALSKQIPREKKFPSGWKCYKTIVHTSSMRSSRYEALGRFGEHSTSWSCSRLRLEQLLCIFRALETSRVLHILMNARWRMNQLLNDWWSFNIAYWAKFYNYLLFVQALSGC